jgi:uncharacterized protein
VPANAARIRKAMLLCFGAGFAAAASVAVLAVFVKPTPRPTLVGFVMRLLFQLNRPLLCVAYVGAVALLMQRPRVRRYLHVFADAGRMPLTNYVMQSVIATTIFYSHGLELFGRVGPLVALPIAVGIFVVQVVYSKWWLARFQHGPLDWVWRALSYGRLPPMRLRSRALAPAVVKQVGPGPG